MKILNIKKNIVSINKIEGKKGFVMLFAVILSSIILAITLGVMDIALKEINFTTPARTTNEAFLAADLGVECALFNDKSTSNVFVMSGGVSSFSCAGNPVLFSGAYPDWDFSFSGVGSNNKSCARVHVNKNGSVTTITSKGHNFGDSSCLVLGQNVVEREYVVIVGGSVSSITPPSSVNYNVAVSSSGSGGGTITSNPAGINCGANCSALFANGTGVDLTASANVGSTFTGWSGDCSGIGVCTLTVDSNKNVTANFSSSTPSSFPVIAGTNGSTEQTDTNTHTVNLPSSISSGDLLIVFFSVDGNPSTTTWPAGWTQLFSDIQGSSDVFSAYYKIANGSEGASISVSTSDAERSAHQSFRITGFTGFPQSATAKGNSNNPNPPALSPSWGLKKTLWIAALGRSSGSNISVSSAPAGYGNLVTQAAAAAAAGTSQDTARQNLEVVTEDPGVFVLTSSQSWVAATVGIQGL